MVEKTPPKPNLCTVRGDYSIPDSIKDSFGLSDLLKTTANGWKDPKALINSYFNNALTWEDDCYNYFTKLSAALLKFGDSDCETSKVRSYAKEIS